jgi:hypothetical protein
VMVSPSDLTKICMIGRRRSGCSQPAGAPSPSISPIPSEGSLLHTLTGRPASSQQSFDAAEHRPGPKGQERHPPQRDPEGGNRAGPLLAQAKATRQAYLGPTLPQQTLAILKLIRVLLWRARVVLQSPRLDEMKASLSRHAVHEPCVRLVPYVRRRDASF